MWDKRQSLVDKNILEIGSGTSLPGILASKCGAHVTLSDNCTQPKSINHIHRCCYLNDLFPKTKTNEGIFFLRLCLINFFNFFYFYFPLGNIKIIGLTWGLLLNDVFNLGPIDLIIAADCFYDPTVFENILVTVSFILQNNIGAKFIFSYQERSTDWSLEPLLKKWDLKCSNINLEQVGVLSGIDIHELMSPHSIFLLEITLR